MSEIKSPSRNELAAIGAIYELIGMIGKVKATYFVFEKMTSRKAFMFARLTKIQEDLLYFTKPKKGMVIVKNIIKDLEDATVALNTPLFAGIPGTSLFEADVYLLWTVTQRVHRQLSVTELSSPYTVALSDYFLHLATITIE